jgi:serine/threonine protein phosphatase PrpC
VGDLRASKAIICTPDIFRVPITGDGKTHRLVLGSDGLWDVMTNEEVGQIVCRLQKKETGQDDIETSASASNEGTNIDVGGTIIVDPNKAASKLMEECLHNGGHMDDVTILIVDVTATMATTQAKITNNI